MIFIDTGAFLARYVARDQYHRRASLLWEKIRERFEPCLTSNFVLDETFTLLGRWAGYDFAAERALNIYGSKRLTILRPTEEDEKQALKHFRKFADHKVSFTDCISFVLMKKNRIERVFTFDYHFEVAGFQLYQ